VRPHFFEYRTFRPVPKHGHFIFPSRKNAIAIWSKFNGQNGLSTMPIQGFEQGAIDGIYSNEPGFIRGSKVFAILRTGYFIDGGIASGKISNLLAI
jgi:hypothetical protein